jgi:hypothetical protein
MNVKSILPGQTAISITTIGKLDASTVVKVVDVDQSLIYISLVFDGMIKVFSLAHNDFSRDFTLMTIFFDENITNKKPASSKLKNSAKKSIYASAPNLYLNVT